MKGRLAMGVGALMGGLALTAPARAHDPVFGIGPHVLYQGGVEVAAEAHRDQAGDDQESELGLELTYGLTGDWAAGVELPYVRVDGPSGADSGAGDVRLFTKYRFWRRDRLALQESMALFGKVKLDTAQDGLGTGTTDSILGLAYGYESRKWYRFASARYRRNGTADNGLRRGDAWLVDLVGGIRPRRTGYLEPDTVWLLELNGEFIERATRNGARVADSGGTRWFLSPGIFWTLRNFAVKAGVQIPIAQDPNGDQEKIDYRAKLVLEWHL